MPGSFCTSVLRTRDMERAAAFYSALVGWTAQDVPGARGHRLLQFGGKTVGSLHQVADGSDLWVPYVSVESAERATGDALSLGARLVDRADVPGLARLATLRDPEGAMFGLWEPAPHQGAELTADRARPSRVSTAATSAGMTLQRPPHKADRSLIPNV